MKWVMKQLDVKAISEVGTDQYEVTLVDKDGEETRIVVAPLEIDGMRMMTEVYDPLKPDVFMRGYIDARRCGTAKIRPPSARLAAITSATATVWTTRSVAAAS